ncbi:MAG: sodium:proton antiporter, partial [Spirochaetota bacterium]|nr:sodium:proton antiporter [Spirochaetota bacterium]
MQVFEYVLILLVAVLLSNVINRFVPLVSVPIIQIALGALASLLPFEFQFDPELFFVLFIAPLVFYTSMMMDKKTMWKMKGVIIGSAVALVFITVCAVGGLIHLLIPAIPFAAACVLIGALGPTDDVAVDSVRRRVRVPPKIMSILSGESIINDASGIVSFQFALAAVTTGAFSVGGAAIKFLLLGFGGIFAGVIMIWFRQVGVRWLRSLGMDNVTLHILLDILTPFVIYMAAEALHVSGILAVFAAGIGYSVLRDRLNPETIQLHIAQENIWEALAFTLNGVVFVMLGTQLPDILRTARGFHELSPAQIAGIVFIIMLALLLTRFIWFTAAVRRKIYQDPDIPIGQARAALLFSLAGARGAVTLASVMSIPLLLADGSAFPERSLIILLASGVIVISLLITNFILPLFAAGTDEKTRSAAEDEAYAEIIQTVTARLLTDATEENRRATLTVVGSYYRRENASPLRARSLVRQELAAERELLLEIFAWEKENTLLLLEEGRADEETARQCIAFMDERLVIFSRKRKHFTIHTIFSLLGLHHRKQHTRGKTGAPQESMDTLLDRNADYVLKKLRAKKTGGNDALYEKLESWYTLSAAIRHGRKGNPAVHLETNTPLVSELALKGFRIERGLIQDMYEAGRLSWKTAREMRGNIATL